ncbi:MAG: radical SAM protein [Ignavibacteriaceae bacterium]
MGKKIDTKEITKYLAYTPAGMSLEEHSGWGTLLFATSRACNLSCYGCWTSVTNRIVKKQLKEGAEWLYDNFYDINVLDSILRKFSKENGQLVACMSDGEPLVSANYHFTSELAKSCGRNNLPLLLFTNGLYLDKIRIAELVGYTLNKISFCVSLQTGNKERYGDFMLIDKKNNTGEKVFNKLEENYDAWMDFDKDILAKTGMHGIAIHTYIIPGKTKTEDIESLKHVVEILGDVPFIVSTMGLNTYASLKGLSINTTGKSMDLIRQYLTGPTALLTVGENDKSKLCSYIAHGNYPLEQSPRIFGITFNPFYKGQLQTCPYHTVIGSSDWLNLRDYLDVMKEQGKRITDEYISSWLENAIKVETMITTAAFDFIGYEHCLMRHSKKAEIDLFISGINIEMAKNKNSIKLNINNDKYFDTIVEKLFEAIENYIHSRKFNISKNNIKL